jgi:hypothetical protein
LTISLVGTFGAGVDTGNPAPTLPAGIAFGDAIGAIGVCSTSQTLTAPAGWSVKSGWPKDSGNARTYAWVKDAATASDGGATVTFTSSGGNKVCVAGFVLRSTNGVPTDWTDQLTWQAHTTGTSYTAPSSTSSAAGDWGVAAFVCRGTDPTSWTPATGLTERQDLQRAGTGATSLHLADSNGSIGGASTTWGPFSESNISTTGGGGLTWLVKENATGGGGGGGGGGGAVYPKLGLWAEHGGTWTGDMTQAETVYGAFQGHWSQYYTAGGTLPIAADVEAAFNAGRDIHIFWKPMAASGSGSTWADVASGLRDTQIDAVATDIINLCSGTGRKIWLTIHHEAEDDYINHGSGGTGWTAANYRGMWQQVRTRFNTAGASQYVVWVLVWQNSHSHPQEMIDLYGNDGVMDGLVDVVSQQDYIAAGTDPARLAEKWIEDLEFLVTNSTASRNWSYLDKPQAFTEWGADHGGVVRGTATHRAQTIDAIRGILPDLASRNVTEIRYFDARTNVIDFPPSVDGVAFQALKDASEAGQSTGPVFVAGVALARDGATVTSSSIPFVLPAGWQQGDLALVWLSTNSNPTMSTVPAGWVLEEGPVANSTIQVGWRFSKVLQAGEPNPTWVISQGVRPSGVMVVLRGADGATPEHAQAALTATSSGTSHAAAAITTTADEAFVLTAWLFRWADGTGGTPSGSVYGTPPGTHTTVGTVSVNSGANPGAGALVASLNANPVGPGSYGSYTATVPVTSTGVCGQVALVPGGIVEPPPAASTGVAVGRVAVGGQSSGVAGGTVPAAAVIPEATVQVAFASQPMAATPTWTTLPSTGTGKVEAPLVVTHGRADEFSQPDPGTARMRLRNDDGRYTMGKTGGPYGSGVKIRRRGRVRVSYQGVVYDRFDGHAGGWPTQWEVEGAQVAYADVTFTDRLLFLARPAGGDRAGKLRSMLEEETLRDSPSAYFPLSEAEGATSAGSIARTPQASGVEEGFGSGGGVISFGQGTGPGTDGLSAAVFDPVTQFSGRLLRANPVAVDTGSPGAVTLSCWFATTSVPSPNTMTLAALTTGPGDDAVILAVWPTGQVQAFVKADGGGVFGNLSPGSYNDGRSHHAAVTLSRSAAGVVTVRLYVDGVQRQTGTFARGLLGAFSELDIGGFHVGDEFAPYAGTLSHVAAFPTALSAARIATQYQAGATGLQGERTDQRIARVADWIGFPAADRALDVGDKTMGPQSTAGKPPLEVMREAAAVEQGVLFVNGTGKLVFHRLGRRYNRTSPDLTLDCSAGHVQVGLVMPGDDFGMVNDVEVTRPGGATQRALNQASIDEYGPYSDSLEAPTVSDSEAQAIGSWRVGNYGEPRQRIPNLTVHLAKLHGLPGGPALVTQILNLEISSLVRLTNLPTQAPGTSVDVFVEGWTETISPHGDWAIELNCSPADYYTVAQLGLTATVTLPTARVAL